MSVTRTWYRAKLLPAAQGIFTDGFYPEPNRQGHQYVWFTQVDLTPLQQKVLVASRPQLNSFRILTLQLALSALEPLEKATRAESLELDFLFQDLERNI